MSIGSEVSENNTTVNGSMIESQSISKTHILYAHNGNNGAIMGMAIIDQKECIMQYTAQSIHREIIGSSQDQTR